jgi:hypothetical protein
VPWGNPGRWGPVPLAGLEPNTLRSRHLLSETTMRRPPFLAILLLLLASGPPEAQGQLLLPRGQHGLSFGDLLGGLSKHVPPTDPANAARFRITGLGGGEIMLSFLLPVSLTGPGGASLPLSFGPTDGGISPDGNSGSQMSFDPQVPIVVSIPPWPILWRRWVYLGGTALPPAQIPLGSYSGTITLTLATVTN